MAQPRWNIPYPRNPLFTGREHILERLATMFSIGETRASTQPLAISGLGGIGKTQTTIEYAYRYREQYRQVLWARADTPENLIQDYVAIARLLQLPEQQLQDQPQIVDAVKRWLREQRQWLLILDNADDLGMVRDFLPKTYTGHILLTTRAQAMGRLARRIELDHMVQAEGTLFLLRRVGILEAEEPLDKVSSRDQATALAIVKEMDGLPLALDQAGAYVEETGCGLAGYLTRYQQRWTELLKARGENTSDHPESVATTWSLSFEKVEQANPAAADLLRLCAFLAPDAIPEEEIVIEGAADLTPMLKSLASDPFLLDAAIKELLRYSLIKRNAEEKLLSLHRLVQTVLKDAMVEEVQHAWAERAVRAVNRAFPAVEFENWDQCRRMLTHAQACADLISQWNIKLPEAASLLYRTGSFLYAHGQYVETEPFLQGTLDIGEQSLGPDHPDVAIYLNDLAWLFMRNLDKKAEAETLIQRALVINEQNFGNDHPNTANTLHSLGQLYWGQKPDQAELLFQRVLAIRERTLGPDHPLTANTIHALAALYREQGRYAEAEPLYQRALVIKEQTLRPDHPDIAGLLSNMAQLYGNQSKYAEGETLLQRALMIEEQAFGPNHPLSVTTLNRMANLYEVQGKHEQAEALYKRALAIGEQAYGPDRVDYWTLDGLAHLYWHQGKYAEAEQLFQRSVAISEQTLGPDHHYTATILSNLANFYHDQGKYAEAEPLYQRALAIKEQALIPDHISIEHTLEKYATLLRQIQRPEEAAQLEERAREIRARRSS